MSDVTRISDTECELIDPITGGKWKIVSSFPISSYGAMLAVTETLLQKNIRPQHGATLTVDCSIKIGESE